MFFALLNWQTVALQAPHKDPVCWGNIRRPATPAWNIKPLLIVTLAGDGSTRTKTVISRPAAAMVMMVCGGASSEPSYIIIGSSSLFPRERKLWCKQQRHVKHRAVLCVCVCVCDEAFSFFGRFSFSSIFILFQSMKLVSCGHLTLELDNLEN